MTARPPGTTWVPYGFVVLAVCTLLLIAGAWRGRRGVAPLLSRDGYFAGWATGHGSYEPHGLVRWWLGRVFAVARPMAAWGVSPTVLTLSGAVVAGLVPCLAAVGPRWLLLAGLAVAVSAVLDSLDGAVAVLSARTTSWGFLLDSLVDRVADAAYLAAFWLVGAAGWLVVLAGFWLGMLEYARARAGNAGMTHVGVVTVGERPTRVIIAASFLITAGIFCGVAADVVAIAAAGIAAVSVIGFVQVLVVASRSLGR
ncbi:MAG: archaetidylinositol phosphate synthase [Frankiales bacterium]|nr:archaetidylinositol phosphate synthase [Frankiales bacterium]